MPNEPIDIDKATERALAALDEMAIKVRDAAVKQADALAQLRAERDALSLKLGSTEAEADAAHMKCHEETKRADAAVEREGALRKALEVYAGKPYYVSEKDKGYEWPVESGLGVTARNALAATPTGELARLREVINSALQLLDLTPLSPRACRVIVEVRDMLRAAVEAK